MVALTSRSVLGPCFAELETEAQRNCSYAAGSVTCELCENVNRPSAGWLNSLWQQSPCYPKYRLI